MVFRPTSGRSAGSVALLATATVLAGCYTFQGGGGFPDDIRTVYIAPFENRTNQFDVDQELIRRLTENLPRQLGIRLGSEQTADAVVRGRITGYSDAAQNYTAGQPGTIGDVLQHQVQITIAIELIDVKRNEILWDSQGLTGRGEYRPDSQSDQIARIKAIESLIQQIVDGAQSQW